MEKRCWQSGYSVFQDSSIIYKEVYSMLNKVLLIVGLITFVVTPLNAQSFKIGPQIGFQKATDADEGRLMFGGAVRARLIPLLGVEASIGYRQEKFANDALTVRSWPVMVTGLIYPLPIIYGAMGAGWYNTTFDYNQASFPSQNLKDETRQEFGWHFGAGVEVPVGQTSKVTVDFRYVFLNYDFKSIPGSGDIDSNSFIVTGGFLFGL
jgi:outer membrane protein W